MRGVRFALGLGTLVVALACGGGAGGGLGIGGGGVGEYARTFAAHMEATHGLPCPTFRKGDEVKLGDGTYVLADARIIEPDRSYGISGTDPKLKDPSVKGLALTWRVRNDTPLKARILQGRHEVTTNLGERAYYVGNATETYRKPHGYVTLEDLPPGTWLETAYVYASPPEAANGAVVRIYREEERKDARGRKEKFLAEHVCVDIGTPTDALAD